MPYTSYIKTTRTPVTQLTTHHHQQINSSYDPIPCHPQNWNVALIIIK